MTERPEWLLTKEAILVMMQREGHSYNSVELAVELERRIDTAYAQHRKEVEWLQQYGEEDAIGSGETAYHFYAIQLPLDTWKQFIAQGKGKE